MFVTHVTRAEVNVHTLTRCHSYSPHTRARPRTHRPRLVFCPLYKTSDASQMPGRGFLCVH